LIEQELILIDATQFYTLSIKRSKTISKFALNI